MGCLGQLRRHILGSQLLKEALDKPELRVMLKEITRLVTLQGSRLCWPARGGVLTARGLPLRPL